MVRDEISSEISAHLDLSKKLNWSKLALHDDEKCRCDRGAIGQKQRKEANEKRRAYYQTPAGIAMKKKYKEKADVKREILKHLGMIHVSKKASLTHEKLEKLVKIL